VVVLDRAEDDARDHAISKDLYDSSGGVKVVLTASGQSIVTLTLMVSKRTYPLSARSGITDPEDFPELIHNKAMSWSFVLYTFSTSGLLVSNVVICANVYAYCQLSKSI
jgi:hypothetical protein